MRFIQGSTSFPAPIAGKMLAREGKREQKSLGVKIEPALCHRQDVVLSPFRRQRLTAQAGLSVIFAYRRMKAVATQTFRPPRAGLLAKHLDGKYTAWGRVIYGIRHTDALKKGSPPSNPDSIKTMRLATDVK